MVNADLHANADASPHANPHADPMNPTPDLIRLRQWARELGFANLGIADLDLDERQAGLQAWISAGHHGELDYMSQHGSKRWRPAELLPGTLSALMVTIDYAPRSPRWVAEAWERMAQDERAFVSRYALGRDYHKVVRARLVKLAKRIEQVCGPIVYRPFCDSAPVMEVELARKAGLGWRGKHTLLLNRDQGSMFFIGTLYTSLNFAAAELAAAELVAAEPGARDGEHCGQCQRCIDVCPTRAIVAPYRVDARRCISYLTIELKGSIPVEFRRAIGNRIYGCDDCQLACPWNKYAVSSPIDDFAVRNNLDAASLIELFSWTEQAFADRMAGSAIARIGHDRWLRNLAVAIGNALAKIQTDSTASRLTTRLQLVEALKSRLDHGSAMVREHVQWAIDQNVE